LKKEFNVEVEWKAFELRPGTPPEGMSRPVKPGETGELSQSVRNLAGEIDLKMIRPSFTPNSRPALEAAEYAKEKGKFEAFHLAVFKAFWEDARNIGLHNVLREIAESCGLDGAELLQALDEGRYTASVVKQDAEAHEMGINGIPAYIVGNYFIEGAQPYSFFQKAVNLLKRRKKSE
jgi:predicted DsbA family dithiol-disulfide isomerase